MLPLHQIKKRNGHLVAFDQAKITEAIWKAAQSVGGQDQTLAAKISNQVTAVLEVFFKSVDTIPTVEQIQDLVEKILIEGGHARTAKAYILYRQKQEEIRTQKAVLLGQEKQSAFSLNALKIFKQKYLHKDQEGNVTETPEEFMRHLARVVAQTTTSNASSTLEEKFYKMLVNLDFLPSEAILTNAHLKQPQYTDLACLTAKDSMESIFETVKKAALLHQAGAKIELNMGALRPRGDVIAETQEQASGPVAFIKVFDAALEAIKPGSGKKLKHHVILNVNHPDILEFMSSKKNNANNFDCIINLTTAFLDALQKHQAYHLINPRNGEIINSLDAQSVLDLIISNAWSNGQLSLSLNGYPLKEKTYVSGWINLAHMVQNGELNFPYLKELIPQALQFLANASQKQDIRIGIIGFADALAQLNTTYDSKKSLEYGEAIIKFLEAELRESAYPNATLTINEEEMLSNIAETSAGIEPFPKTISHISPEWHIHIQALFQQHTLGVVHKMLYFPQTTSIEQLKKAFLEAASKGCKKIDITAYNITKNIDKKETMMLNGNLRIAKKIQPRLEEVMPPPIVYQTTPL